MKNNVEDTVVLQFAQGTTKGTAVIVPFLNFLWLLFLFQDKKVTKAE
jgi:hypothetical protein